MKRTISTFIKICMMLCLLTGCAGGGSSTSENDTIELTVFAAASMTETLTEIAALYKEATPEVELVFNFDSSGTLKTQIEEGAACDVFISAAEKQMDELEDLAMIETETRKDLLENKIALVVSGENKIHSFEDLASALGKGEIMLSMGNADVPAGQYTQKIFAFYGLDEQKLANAGCISYGTNVKEVATQVAEAAVDCGVIYATDAYSAGLTVVDTATAEMCGQVIYPAAVLAESAHPEAAQAFLDFLTTQEACEIFENVGFTPF